MKYLYWLIIFVFPLILFSHPKSYDPWYAGTLFSYSGNSIEAKKMNIQPYLSYNREYSNPIANSLSPLLFYQVGITDNFNVEAIAQCFYKENNQSSTFKFGDTLLGVGYQLLREKEFTIKPSIRLFVQEVFPTGKYKNLNPQKLGIDSTGAGVYQTSFGLALSKIVYWSINHPINFRINLFYSINTNAHVSNFNAYGGGYGSFGKVNVGNNIYSIFALEYSFNQRWVYAMDLIYSFNFKSTFKGKLGVDSFGRLSNYDNPFISQLYVAPALEYNFSQNLGLVAGVYLPLSVKHTHKVISAIITVNYVFSVR